ncbi:hypothetical protein Taro_043566 [Colocasia esculenta]|uniref:Uncharacterized protein n=1 Tax=Colocasia esculenta TaxID=4460 RepID=A0A843X0X9_COLES|nr:hypothetical protein [Colocasia esculenta]
MAEADGEAWVWAAATSAQLAAGVASYRRGYPGGRVNPSLMPFKAFLVASLFVGAGATAVMGAVRAAGIRKVEDMKGVGASVRRRLGAAPRAEGESSAGVEM